MAEESTPSSLIGEHREAVEMSSSGEGEHNQSATVTEWQASVIDLFIHMTQTLGLPRSLGQIYGLLFTVSEPLDMEDIRLRLKISKGSASQGLRILRQVGAVRSVFLVGQRREHFHAEMSLRRLVSGFSSEVLEPHMDSGGARIRQLNELISNMPETDRAFARERVQTLSAWRGKAQRLLPLVRNFL